MIARINIGSSLYGALAYNQEKVDENLGKVLASNLVCEPMDGRFSVLACANDFARWMPSPEHLPTKKPVIHISLNPYPDDKLTDNQLADIGREYMERLGYGGQPYLIFKHEDIGRDHIHIVSLRVDCEGKLIKNSFEHKRSKEITELLEKKYGLIPAEGQKQSEQWKLTPVDPEQGNLKKQMSSVIKTLVNTYKFQTLGEFRALLSLYNIGLEEVKGEVRGKSYRGLLYSASDKDGNKVGTPLKSSLFGKLFGFEELEKRMLKCGEQIKQQGFSERTRTAIGGAVNNSGSETELREKLKVLNIDLVLRRNDQNRIYGVTFIDHNNQCVFNGSRLGKEFSANAFNGRFGQQPESENKHQPIENPDNHKQIEKSTTSDISHTVGALFDFLPLESTSNPNDYTHLKKGKRKKKRRYGRQN
ncbi:MAG: relaxase/mobilization nuclease domain-containing protein [Prolixibacteraceae bacterium]|nr:relaxase/mobilization nuclease domain-containing protein [Prolixibacteraceae bacterium]